MWQHVTGGQGEREYLPLSELEGAEVCVAAAPLGERARDDDRDGARRGGDPARCAGATSRRCAR